MTPDLSQETSWRENPDALIAVSLDGTILRWNPAAETVFGFSSREAVGQPLAGLVVPADQADEERRILDLALRDGLSLHESLRRRKDGTLAYVSVSTKAVRDPSGEFQYFLCSKKDAT